MQRISTLAATLTFFSPLGLLGVASAAPQDPAVNEAIDDSTEGTQDDTADVEETDEWEALDSELRGLDTLDQDYSPTPDIWGYAQVNIFTQDDGNKAGANLDNVRLNLTGTTHGAAYRLTSEFASGSAVILDAWLSTALGESLAVTLGLFKIPLLRSGLVEARDLLFISRTRNGLFYSRRDQGVMINGDHGRFHWAAAVQNGAAGNIDRSLTTMAAQVNLIGDPPLPWEGSYQAGRTTRLTLGVGFSNDDAVDFDTTSDGTAIALEAYAVHNGVSFQAEWLDYGQDYSATNAPGSAEQRGNTSPWSMTLAYMLVPDRYEVALRYDEFNDDTDASGFDRHTATIGVNRYIQGHDIKWQLNFAGADKGGALDGPHDYVLALGLTASF